MNKINANTVLFFDMDGTLIYTNFANFISYKEAIQSVIQGDKEISYKPNERFTRTSLKKIFPNLTSQDYQKIIQAKEKNYKKHLSQTKLNKSIAEILTRYYKTNQTVLVTNSQKDRALMTLNYHNLTDKFSHLFFRKISDCESWINKYENAISKLNLSAEMIVVFENEKQEIEDAILAGISINNILNV